jgi:AcrR family transcriptional regulator
MTAGASEATAERGRPRRLTADRVIESAVTLADRIGADALTIRKLADALDVKPMTIYHRVAGDRAVSRRALTWCRRGCGPCARPTPRHPTR